MIKRLHFGAFERIHFVIVFPFASSQFTNALLCLILNKERAFEKSVE